MNWVTVIWSMTAAACLTISLVHVMVWFSDRSAWANLAFALCAVTTAGFAGLELWMMHETTVEQMQIAVRWYQVPILVIFLGIVGFVRVYFRAGRFGLAWLAVGFRTAAFVMNFWLWPNLNFQVTGIKRIPLLGETVSVVDGVPQPFMLLGQASLLLLVLFIADATRTVWRRGERNTKLLMAGTMVIFTLAGTVMGSLTFSGIVSWPFATSLYYLPVIAVMAYEMSRATFQASRLARELQLSETRMNLAAEAASVGLWTWGPRREQLWGSAQWREMLGFAAQAEVRFDDFLQRLHPLDRERVGQAMSQVLQQRSTHTDEFRVVLPDGSQHWIASRGRSVEDASGQALQMFGAVSDITKRKNTEIEVAQQRTQLAHLSRVSTLGELSGSLAHELNQPLTAILSNAQAAQRFLSQPEPDLDEVRDILQDIVGEDKRAGEIIARLRLLFRGGEVTFVALDVNRTVADVLDLLHSDIVQHGVQVSRDLADGLPDIEGDRVSLQQVLINLVMNASEAMAGLPRSERRLSIQTRVADTRSICVSVADNGPGIAYDKLEQVFEPFYTDKPQGMGLGLSVCRTIVQSHSGRLWAENTPMGGARLRFTLPIGAR